MAKRKTDQSKIKTADTAITDTTDQHPVTNSDGNADDHHIWNGPGNIIVNGHIVHPGERF